MIRYREIGGGGSEESIKPLILPHILPQTPPSYPRITKLVISHFPREAVRIPATDTFDMADADTCRRLEKKKVVEDNVFRNGCISLIST